MFEREPRKGYVIVSVELPRDVADLLADRQRDLVTIIETLGHQCRCLPPTAEVQAEENRLRKQREQERQAYFKKLGRASYRLYRRRIKTNGYSKFDGEYRYRPAQLSKAQWRRLVVTDIAEELGVTRDTIELVALPRFSKELHDKIKPRRDQAIIRLYLDGRTNREIAARVKVSTTTVSRFLQENRDRLKELFKNQVDGK